MKTQQPKQKPTELTLTLRLTVTYDPAGDPHAQLRRRLGEVVREAVNNGTLTGDGPATVTCYSFTVRNGRPPTTREKAGALKNRLEIARPS